VWCLSLQVKQSLFRFEVSHFQAMNKVIKWSSMPGWYQHFRGTYSEIGGNFFLINFTKHLTQFEVPQTIKPPTGGLLSDAMFRCLRLLTSSCLSVPLSVAVWKFKFD
jgi:hypothetical protein